MDHNELSFGDLLTNEQKELIDDIKSLYEYKGVVFSAIPCPPHRVKAAIVYDRFRAGDIMVHSYPKTGTHFIGDTIKSILLESEGFDCTQNINGKKYFMNALEICPHSRSENPMADLDESPSPRLIATHLPWSHLPEGSLSAAVKHIQVIRNPKDTLCSAFAAQRLYMAKEFPWNQFVDQVISKKLILFMDYFDYMKTWYPHRHDDNVLTLYYEDMKQDHRSAVLKLCMFLDISLNDEQIGRVVEVNTFENRVKNADPYSTLFLNKGKSGGWKNWFTVAQNEAANNWIAEGIDGLEELTMTFQ